MSTTMELKKYIRHKGIIKKREIDFFLKYIENGGNGTQAMLAVRPELEYHIAGAMASRLLGFIDVNELLNISGHGPDKLMQAMDKLFESDPASYVKFYDKFAKLTENHITIDVNHNIEPQVKEKLARILDE